MGGNGAFSDDRDAHGAGSRITGGAGERPRGSFAAEPHTLEDGTVTVAVQGDLDLATAPSLKRALGDVLAGGTSAIVLDLAGVGFIDSTALGVLVGFHRHLPDGARLAIAGAGPDVLNVFELTGLDATFEIFGSLEDALGWARGSEAATG